MPPLALLLSNPAFAAARVAIALRLPERHINATGAFAVELAERCGQLTERDVRGAVDARLGELAGFANVDELQFTATQGRGRLARREGAGAAKRMSNVRIGGYHSLPARPQAHGGRDHRPRRS